MALVVDQPDRLQMVVAPSQQLVLSSVSDLSLFWPTIDGTAASVYAARVDAFFEHPVVTSLLEKIYEIDAEMDRHEL